MKTILLTVVTTACAAFGVAAMPTKEEVARVEPIVQKLMEPEHAALASGKMTRAEVAAAAMDLAGKADTEAAKLLLMKGAFVLYVRDGNLEKAVETMNALESAIADVPPECVENMVELALLGVSKKEDGTRLRQFLGDAKNAVAKDEAGVVDGKAILGAIANLDNGNEKYRTVVGMLFPGWAPANAGDDCGSFLVRHRGVSNVLVVHPPNKETPVVLSRTVKISGKNPCLFLKVSSFDTNWDSLLGVRVDGRDAMPFRVIGTMDFDPWEELVVPLFAWRGREVKIEIIQKGGFVHKCGSRVAA